MNCKQISVKEFESLEMTPVVQQKKQTWSREKTFFVEDSQNRKNEASQEKLRFARTIEMHEEDLEESFEAA